MVLERVIKPYPYQLPVISTVKATLAIRDFVLFVMAMGLGKTVTSAFIVEDYLREGKRGLFLCHETYILEQVEDEYRKVLGDDLVYKTFYGSERDGKKDWSADQADMLFASFQSMNNWHEKWYLAFDPDHFDFMVVDESHHGQASSYREVIDYFQCKKIGMTATPDRMDLKDIREIFGEEVYTISLEEGIANGWLAGIEYHVLSDGINNAKLKQICEGVFEKGKRVSVKQINETIFIRDRDKAEKEIIDEYSKIKEIAGDRKTLLFCERTKHADNLISHFSRSGVMHSKKTFKENDEVFKAFKDGDLQYVASVNKFNEGKHVPGVEVIVFLRATDSLTIFWQQLGRALAKIGNKTRIIVLDFVSNLERLVQVRDLMLRIIDIEEQLGKTTKQKLPLDENSISVTGENFEFIFSDEIVDAVKLIEALRKGYYQTYSEAQQAVKSLGVKMVGEYSAARKKDLRLPPYPSKTYAGDFTGWADFFGVDYVANVAREWVSEEEVRKTFLEKRWKDGPEYDLKRSRKNYPQTTDFANIYGKTFGEVVYGKKRQMYIEWLSEEQLRKEVTEVYGDRKLSASDYDKNRRFNWPSSGEFSLHYKKTWREVFYGEKLRSNVSWLNEEEIKKEVLEFFDGKEFSLEGYREVRKLNWPLPAKFPNVYGKTWAEVFKGKKREKNIEWLTETQIKEAVKSVFGDKDFNGDNYEASREINWPDKGAFKRIYGKTWSELFKYEKGKKKKKDFKWLPIEDLRVNVLDFFDGRDFTQDDYNQNRKEGWINSTGFNRQYGISWGNVFKKKTRRIKK